MRFNQARREVRLIQYKSGHELRLEGIVQSARINISFTVPDSNQDAMFYSTWVSEPIDLRSIADVEALHERVFEAILTFEAHEVLEHLRIGGQPIWNPHPRSSYHGITRPSRRLYFRAPACSSGDRAEDF